MGCPGQPRPDGPCPGASNPRAGLPAPALHEKPHADLPMSERARTAIRRHTVAIGFCRSTLPMELESASIVVL
jgi:hypothetical protein